ncbi:hypothetical protein Tco_1202226 [Tanacetum coccineum]
MGDLSSIGIRNRVVDRRIGLVEYSLKDQKEDPDPVRDGLLYSAEGIIKHFVVLHAVAIASAQKNKGSLEAESIVRAASREVLQVGLSITPFCSVKVEMRKSSMPYPCLGWRCFSHKKIGGDEGCVLKSNWLGDADPQRNYLVCTVVSLEDLLTKYYS